MKIKGLKIIRAIVKMKSKIRKLALSDIMTPYVEYMTYSRANGIEQRT